MEIEWQDKAFKQLKKIKTKSDRDKIVLASRHLANFPQCKNVKALVNHKYHYRLRVGNFRLLFNIKLEKVEMVSIEEVKKRDEHTY